MDNFEIDETHGNDGTYDGYEPGVSGLVHPISGLLLACKIIGCELSENDKAKAVEAWDDAPTGTKNTVAKALAQTVAMLQLPSASLQVTDDLQEFLACKIATLQSLTRCPAPHVLEKMGCTSVRDGVLTFNGGSAKCGPDGTVLTVTGKCGTLAASGLPEDGLVGDDENFAVAALHYFVTLSFLSQKKNPTPLLSALRAHGAAVAKALELSAETYVATDLLGLQSASLKKVAISNGCKSVFAALKALLLKAPADALRDLASLPSLPYPPMEPLGPDAHYAHRVCSLFSGPVTVLVEASKAKNFRAGLPELQIQCVPVKLEAGNLPDNVVQEQAVKGRLVNLHVPKGDQKAHYAACEKFLHVAEQFSAKFKTSDQKFANFLFIQQQLFDITLVRGPSDRLEEVGVVFTKLTTVSTQFSLNDWTAVISKFLHQDVVKNCIRHLQLAALFKGPEVSLPTVQSECPDLFPIKKKTSFGPTDKGRLQSVAKPAAFSLGYAAAGFSTDLQMFLVDPVEDDAPIQDDAQPASTLTMEVAPAEPQDDDPTDAAEGTEPFVFVGSGSAFTNADPEYREASPRASDPPVLPPPKKGFVGRNKANSPAGKPIRPAGRGGKGGKGAE